MSRDRIIAAIVILIGASLSLALWRILPRPGGSGRLILALIISFGTIAIVKTSDVRSATAGAGRLMALLLMAQLAAQCIVLSGLSQLD